MIVYSIFIRSAFVLSSTSLCHSLQQLYYCSAKVGKKLKARSFKNNAATMPFRGQQKYGL